MRTSDYSAKDERSRGRGDSLGLLEYIFRSLPQFAPIRFEVRKPTTLDLTQTLRFPSVSAKLRNYCSNRKALHFGSALLASTRALQGVPRVLASSAEPKCKALRLLQ